MSSKTSTPATGRTQRPTQRTRLLAVVGAAAAALAVWAVADPLAGIDLTVRTGGGTQEIGSGAVVLVSLVAGLAGWALLDLLERFTAHAREIWIATALVALVLSLLGPLGAAVTAAATVALAGMHLAVSAILIPLLARTAPSRGA
jgi:Family of unknown function (DUF6069)